MTAQHWVWMLVAVLSGLFVLGMLVLIALAGTESAAPRYRRGPSLRYSASDTGSAEWLAEYFARLDAD